MRAEGVGEEHAFAVSSSHSACLCILRPLVRAAAACWHLTARIPLIVIWLLLSVSRYSWGGAALGGRGAHGMWANLQSRSRAK